MAAPFSIVRRLTTLVVAISVAALCLNAVLVFLATRSMDGHLTDTLARQIGSVRLALQQCPPAQRAPLAAALSRLGSPIYRALEPVATDEDIRRLPPPPSVAAPPLLADLTRAVGREVAVEMVGAAEGAPLLRASFSVDGQRWTIDFPAGEAPSRTPLLLALAALALVGLAAVLASAMGVRLITRPLARIADEVADRHQHLRRIAVRDDEGQELQQIVTAFNGLVHAVEIHGATRRQMLAGLSHDLRTPLARLRLRAECECPPRTAQAMDRDFDAMARIISQFLGFVQGAAEVSLGVNEPLAPLVRHIVQRYAGQGVGLEMDDGAVAGCACPDLAVTRILGNLIDNALVHGQPPVVVVVEADAGECRLFVRDAGRGIPAGALARALEPFVKLGPQGDTLGHCGLGLAIVAQICERLGGRVVRRDVEGAGWAVGVVLPRRPAA